MKKYLLLDHDGVLVDTEFWYYRAGERALADVGLTLDKDQYLRDMSEGSGTWTQARAAGTDEQTISRLREARDDYYQEYLRTERIEIEGVVEALAELARYVRMAIVTTAKRVDFDLIHENRQITTFMDFVLVREDYALAKPHPEPYLTALQRFGATQEETLVVEDSSRGLRSAVAAGIECAVVHHDFTRAQDFSRASYRIDALAELTGIVLTGAGSTFPTAEGLAACRIPHEAFVERVNGARRRRPGQGVTDEAAAHLRRRHERQHPQRAGRAAGQTHRGLHARCASRPRSGATPAARPTWRGSSSLGEWPGGFCGLGWKEVGLLELTALPTIGEDRWVPWVREADVLLVDGGDATYLCHWMRESGLADLIPSLTDTVWVGMSAGSMVMTPRIGQDFVRWSGAPDDRTLGLVDFSIFPHLGHELMPDNTLAEAERWAADIGGPAYAMDDQTAIVVTDERVEVVSEGDWTRLPA